MASLTVQRVGLLEKLTKVSSQESSESPLEPMTSTTPSTTSEPEPEMLELSCGPPTSSIAGRSAVLSWAPLGKVPAGLTPAYTIELQQLDSVDSLPNTNWLSVYKGEAACCKVDDLKSGRRYAVRVVAAVEQSLSREESSDHVGVEVRVRNSEYVIFHTPPAVPSLTQPPSLAQRARNALKLKWNVPEDPGGVFELTYVLQISPAPLGFEADRTQMGFVEVYRGPERSYKITKLQPGVRYTSRVQAVNPIGEGPFSLCSAYTTQATVPTAPLPPVVQAASATALTLVWSPPADNGSPIIGYTLERDDGAGGDFALAYVGPNTMHTVKGLKPGSQYRFRLRADNDEGRSLWSSTAVLSTGAAPPDSPLSLQVVTAGHKSATLAWRTPDEDGGSEVVGFEVELQAKSRAATACMGTDWLKIFDGQAHACTINSLRPGCAYRVRVRARNIAGWGQWALPVDLTTAVDVPEVPLSLQPGTCTPTTMVITWAAPRHDGGSKVQCYRLEMASADCNCGRCPHAAAAPPAQPPQQQQPGTAGVQGSVYPSPPPPPPPRSASGTQHLVLCPAHKPLLVYAGETIGAEVRQLQPGCRYIFRVQAVNSHGSGPWTEWVLACTPADVPLPPPPPAITGVAAGALVLAWQVPHAQGAPVTQYTLEAATLPQVPMMSPPGPAGIIADPRVIGSLAFKVAYRGAHANCEVRGLEPYCGYAFRLCAHNEVGASPWSVCSAAITSHAPPTCPVSVSASAVSSCSILLCWAPPEMDFGSAVVSYTVHMAPISRNVASRQGTGGAGANGNTSSGTAAWTQLYTGSACSCTADGLLPGRAYQFRIRAANAFGSGPYTVPVTATTLPAAPSAPGKPAASSRTASGFRVRWDEPEITNGAHVATYVLEVAPVETEEWTVQYSGLEAGAKVTGLQAASKYAVRVAATNSAGQGPFSELEYVTTALLPPQPPSGLHVTEVHEQALVGSQPACTGTPGESASSDAPSAGLVSAAAVGPAVSVAWQEPSAEGPYAGVLGYEVVASPKPGSDAGGAAAGGAVKLNITGRRCDARLDGLAPSCSYCVRVRAVGVDGTGHSGWSEEVAFATPARTEAEAPQAAAGPSGPNVGTSQRKTGAAGKKAKKQQQQQAAAAAAAVSSSSSAIVPTPASSTTTEEVASTTAPAAPTRGRKAASGSTSRVAAAVTTVAAKKLRKLTLVERIVEALPEPLAKGAELVLFALFGQNWRRDAGRRARRYLGWMLAVMVAVLGALFLFSNKR